MRNTLIRVPINVIKKTAKAVALPIISTGRIGYIYHLPMRLKGPEQHLSLPDYAGNVIQKIGWTYPS